MGMDPKIEKVDDRNPQQMQIQQQLTKALMGRIMGGQPQAPAPNQPGMQDRSIWSQLYSGGMDQRFMQPQVQPPTSMFENFRGGQLGNSPIAALLQQAIQGGSSSGNFVPPGGGTRGGGRPGLGTVPKEPPIKNAVTKPETRIKGSVPTEKPAAKKPEPKRGGEKPRIAVDPRGLGGGEPRQNAPTSPRPAPRPRPRPQPRFMPPPMVSPRGEMSITQRAMPLAPSPIMPSPIQQKLAELAAMRQPQSAPPVMPGQNFRPVSQGSRLIGSMTSPYGGSRFNPKMR